MRKVIREKFTDDPMNKVIVSSGPLAGTKLVNVELKMEDGTTVKVPGTFSYSSITKKLVDRRRLDEFISSLGEA